MFVLDHLSDIDETILEGGLQLHKTLLEHEALLLCEVGGDDHSTTFHDDSRCFGDDQHFVTELGQVLRDGGKGGTLTRARPSRE